MNSHVKVVRCPPTTQLKDGYAGRVMASQMTEAPEPGGEPQPGCREEWEPPIPRPFPLSQRGHSSEEGREQMAEWGDRPPLTEGLASCRRTCNDSDMVTPGGLGGRTRGDSTPDPGFPPP